MFTKTIALFTLAASAVFVSAAPVESRDAPQYVHANLIGAADAQYSIQIPLRTWTPTYNALSISHIRTDGGRCHFYGVDGLNYATYGPSYGDVGPPQTIYGAICY